jgi:RNA polymerase sigma-70 factor (ECF subfamily)
VATAESVRRCLARLKPNDAEALLLYEHAGLNCAEIAVLRNEDVAAVRMCIYRARVRFRALYGKENDHELP